MKYLLDSNTCIRFLNQRSPLVVDRLIETPDEDISVCSIVKAEMFYGSQKSLRRERNLAVQRAFFSRYVSLPFDDLAADQYALIRADLEGRGQLIGANDLLIAAIARAHDLTLVTHNTAEFSRVGGLQLEDWEGA
jgi:tRNA(fMet)-specific endonuclease VapC